MKKVFLIAAATLALAACSNDDNYTDDPVAAHISATIGRTALSRASETSWAQGDRIGVSMDSRYTNMEYTTAGDGKFSGTTMYFKNKIEPVTLTAYYPFSGTEGTAAGSVSASTPAALQTPQEQAKFDFLFDKKSGILGNDPNVAFTFSHMMSKITLVFKNGAGADVSKITSYEIGGLRLDGTFNTATGDCAAKADAAAAPIAISPAAVANEKELPSLIVFPQAAPENAVTLTINDSDGQQYACSLNFENNKLASGNNYLFTITVNKTGLNVNASTIIDWTRKESSSDAGSVNPK